MELIIIDEIATADELLKLIKEEYINYDFEFQSTKFRVDHPQKYSKLYYHFKGDGKGTTMEKLQKKIGYKGTSKALLNMSRSESIGVGKLMFYCDLKKCLEQGISFSQIAEQLNVSKQYVQQEYKKLEKRFTTEPISK